MHLSGKHKLSLLLTVLYSLFILPINEHLAFTIPTDRKLLIISYILKLLFAVFFYLLVYFVIHFVEKIRARDKDYLNWLKFSGIYFLILLFVFFLIYPGHWVWDEFHILQVVKSYVPDAWQNYFTNIFYTFSLYLIPTGVSIVLFQMTFISMVVGYVIGQSQKLFKKRSLAYLLLIVFLLPPILLNNFYPLRLTMYSYIELLLLGKLIFLYFKGFKSQHKYTELLVFSTLIMFVSFWRSEGIYYLLLFPIIVWLLKIVNKDVLRTIKFYIYLLLCLAIISFGFLVTRVTHDGRYELTTMINPLSVMIQQPLQGKDLEKRLENIDKVLNLEVLKKYPSYTEVPAFWNGTIREGYEKHVDLFKREFVTLVLDNPSLFLDAKLKTFLAANSFEGIVPLGIGLLASETGSGSTEEMVKERFFTTNYFAAPLSVPLKKEVTKSLLFTDNAGRVNFLGHIFWNVIPVIVLLVAIGLRKLFTRQFFWALIISLILLRVGLIFLTAPAHYFMYYLPVYISGYFIIALIVLLYIDKRTLLDTANKRRVKAATN